MSATGVTSTYHPDHTSLGLKREALPVTAKDRSLCKGPKPGITQVVGVSTTCRLSGQVPALTCGLTGRAEAWWRAAQTRPTTASSQEETRSPPSHVNSRTPEKDTSLSWVETPRPVAAVYLVLFRASGYGIPSLHPFRELAMSHVAARFIPCLRPCHPNTPTSHPQKDSLYN